MLAEFLFNKGFEIFLFEEELAIGGFEPDWLRFPESLSMACFCLSLSAGENYFLFISALEDFAEFQSLSLLLCLVCDVPWLFIVWEETTGLVGTLYSVLRGIEGVLILGVVFKSSLFVPLFDKLRYLELFSCLLEVVLMRRFCRTKLLVWTLFPNLFLISDSSLATEGALRLPPLLLPPFLLPAGECNLFDISLILAFFFACSISLSICFIFAKFFFSLFFDATMFLFNP